MASGFGGRYQGSVVDDADPIGEHRLRVIVPEVWGTEAGAWAVPSLPPGGAATPAVGDLVWVTFEGGDTDYPIWDAGAAPDPDAVPADGHVGRYRALVADNVDPMEEHRLNVKIPEVLGDDTTAWAKAAPDLAAAESAVPDIGTEVWIEFESGDPNYPIWVGVASNGSSNGQPGIGSHGSDLAASTDTRNPRSGGLSGNGRHPPTPA
jgi:hypothetical protein